MQSVDTGYGRLVKLEVAKEGDNVEIWDINKLSPSDRNILMTHSVGDAVVKLDLDQQYRKLLF